MIQKPDFLGTMFVSRGLGFWMAKGPPVDLLDARILEDENPWVVLAALVERAKLGDFRHLALIFRLLRASGGHGAFWNACSDTLAHAGPSSILRQLMGEFHAEIWEERNLWRAEYVVDTLYRSLCLWTVPVMLGIYIKMEGRKQLEDTAEDRDEPSLILVPEYLSRILEEEPGPISEGDLPDLDYHDLVTRTYEQRCRELGSPEAQVLNGRPFSVQLSAERLLDKLAADEVDELEVAEERMLFEGSTGVDCRSFFKDFRLQPLAAAAILESFLENVEPERYEDGVRYFFGHRIPE